MHNPASTSPVEAEAQVARRLIVVCLLLTAATASGTVTLTRWAPEIVGFFVVALLPFWLGGLAILLLAGGVTEAVAMVKRPAERTPFNAGIAATATIVAVLVVSYLVFYLIG
jgi:hypothetical protein